MNHQELDNLQTALNNALNSLRVAMDGSMLPPLSSQYGVDMHPLDGLDEPTPVGVYEARRAALACVAELKNLLQHPFEKAADSTFAMYDVATLQVFVEHGIVDRMAKEPSGVSVKTLQSELNLDSHKLTTILRHLSTCGWIRETQDGIFAMNRSSRVLLQGQRGRALISVPGNMRIAEALPQWLTHPDSRFSQSPDHTAFQLANNTTKPFFEWVKEDRNYLGRFAACVEALGEYVTPGILSDYPWETCLESTVVDCGGGKGSLAISLANKFPALRLVVQERGEMVELAEANIKARLDTNSVPGRVVAEAHDLFSSQPRTGDNYTFMLRHVLHNWPEAQAVSILEKLAAAAGPKSKILIIERISGHYPDTRAQLEHKPANTTDTIASASLITEQAILNSSSRMPQALALHLLCILNCHERTLDQWRTIISRAGLVVTGLYKLRAYVSIMECRVSHT
ncbi:S-adenosyl-L-methionine-dependent methyltransferase [Suillus clintonianus]|uniref:S-adenosyl-L-methionine-dependent methyltransferase n=1 Tax=Suillus clintonianus TaxID=1904413 RepID=UPI001B877B39|nr:S-adenosyl-L-methionine-dependent methyltransferase [Suillus clintonianus]KAG2124864.1 S-adenosyl-L-methionine-dependent methyltransferase [Suillus clintonianus]